MIYTITFNPSLDYIASCTNFELGKTNRTSKDGLALIPDVTSVNDVKQAVTSAIDVINGKYQEQYEVLNKDKSALIEEKQLIEQVRNSSVDEINNSLSMYDFLIKDQIKKYIKFWKSCQKIPKL